MRKQTIAILSILAVGSIFSGIAYATITNTSISDAGITTHSIITDSCTGCTNETDFTTYSLSINKTQAGAFGQGLLVHVGNDKSVLASEANGKTFLFGTTGTLVSITSAQDPNIPIKSGQSESGKYRYILNATSSKIDVYKNNAILQHITVDLTHSFNSFANTAVGISPNGKYIALFGTDVTTNFEQLQVWQGS